MSDNKQQYFMSLYEPVHEPFQRYCRTCANDPEEAKDLAGETILRAYERLDTLRDEKAFLHYLFGIAKRIVLNRRRRNKFRGWVDFARFLTIPDEDQQPEMRHDLNLLYEALESLSPIYREAFVLYEISGFSMNEVAEIETCSLSAAKVRVLRARKKLSETLSDPEMNRKGRKH